MRCRDFSSLRNDRVTRLGRDDCFFSSGDAGFVGCTDGAAEELLACWESRESGCRWGEFGVGTAYTTGTVSTLVPDLTSLSTLVL